MRTAPFASVRSLFAITDEQAMWRVQSQDDERAFSQLVGRWEGPIQRLCARMTGDIHRGEDLAQETFTRVFAKRNDYQPSGKFSTWLWRIALNLCYDELRRRRRRDESSLDAMCGEAMATLEVFVAREPAPDKSLVDQERSELVRKALMQLTETYRTVLVLRHYEDLKFREIAEVLEVPEGTVKSRMAEALTQMSRLLKPMLADSHSRSNHRRASDGNAHEFPRTSDVENVQRAPHHELRGSGAGVPPAAGASRPSLVAGETPAQTAGTAAPLPTNPGSSEFLDIYTESKRNRQFERNR